MAEVKLRKVTFSVRRAGRNCDGNAINFGIGRGGERKLGRGFDRAIGKLIDFGNVHCIIHVEKRVVVIVAMCVLPSRCPKMSSN